MKLWLVTYDGSVGYDDYDGFVVRATNKDSARALVRNELGPFTSQSVDDFTVRRLREDGDPGGILASFNAG